MRKDILKLVLIGFLLSLSTNIFSQEKDSIYITGTIVDKNSSPLSDAYVGIVETNNGVFTDNEGKYKINITQPLDSLGKATLHYEFIGYNAIEKEIDSTILTSDNIVLNVKLEDRKEFECSLIYKEPPFYKRAWDWIKNIFKKEE